MTNRIVILPVRMTKIHLAKSEKQKQGKATLTTTNCEIDPALKSLNSPDE